MSKKQTKKFLAYAIKPGMTETQQLKAQLDMALDVNLSQKITIAHLSGEVKKLGVELRCRPPANINPLIKHCKDW